MKIIEFPEDFSVGRLLIGRCYNERSWSKAIEAKGKIEVPENKYISFWVDHKLASSDLNFCSLLKSNDLKEFLVASSRFDDSKIEKILHLSSLTSLQLWETFITDEALKQLYRFPKLRYLGLDTTKITDLGLSYLKKSTSLKSLSIYCNDINDEGLSHLTKLNLMQLDIGWTNVSDDSVTILKQMNNLKYLRIFDTKITESGFFELKKALPDCLIWFHKSNNL